jgi:biotin carboxylase
MILGAGVFQVAAIRKAVDLGYHVLTVDYLPDNIGHSYSHGYVNASTQDVEAVTEAAFTHHIDGIFTIASDIALPTVAKVAAKLGLPGPTEEQVNTLIMKDRFRPFQATHGDSGPAFIEVDDLSQAINNWSGGTTIIRPAISSGSRGIAKIEKVDSTCRALFDSARQFSFSGKVCLEEYIRGIDISVEGFVLGGTIHYAFITHKHVKGFAVVGHELPGYIEEVTRERIVAQLQKLITAANYEAGPFDADLRLDSERVVVLEMTPRLGGNAIPILVEKVYGVPLIELSIRHIMGDLLAEEGLEPPLESMPHGAVLLRSDRSGMVKTLASETTIRTRLPEIVDICMNLLPGEKVERFVHGEHVFGYCILDMAQGYGFESLSAKVLDSLAIEFQQVDVN